MLSLVLVDALDLDVEESVRVDIRRGPSRDDLREGDLVVALGGPQSSLQGRVVGVIGQFLELGRIVEHALAENVDQDRGQGGIGFEEPAPERDAVGLVVDAIRVERMRSLKTVWRIRSVCSAETPLMRWRPDEGQSTHLDALPPAFVDDRDAAQHGGVRFSGFPELVEMERVDEIDDLHVTGQNSLHQRHRPGLQGLGQQRVVGVAERLAGDLPGIVPGDLVQIDELPHQLDHRNGRMRVVQLDRGLVRKVA